MSNARARPVWPSGSPRTRAKALRASVSQSPSSDSPRDGRSVVTPDRRASSSDQHFNGTWCASGRNANRRVMARRKPRALRCAFIVGTVSLSMIDVGKSEVLRGDIGIIGERIAERQKLKAKPGDMLRGIREDIVISCPAVKIEELCSSLDVQYILWRDSRFGRPRSQASSCRSVRWKESVPSLSGGIVKIKPSRQNGCAKLALRMHVHVFSGSIAAIFPIRAESPMVEISRIVERPERQGSGGEYESAFPSDHGFSGGVGRSAGFLERQLQEDNLPNQSEELEGRDPNQGLGVISKVAVKIDQLFVKPSLLPFGLRSLIAFFFVTFSLCIASLSGQDFYYNRGIRGAALVGISAFIGLFGLLLGLAPFPKGWLL
jgi:hypothetical protein